MTATPSGTLFCPECWRIVNPENEPKRNCPVDGMVMKKQFMAEVLVIDVCPKCDGVWFERAEIDFLNEKARERDQYLGLTMALLSIL
jgi:hypothetical protein